MLVCATLDHFTLKSILLWVSVWVRWLTHVFGSCISTLKVRKTTVFWMKTVVFWLRRQDSNLRPPGYEHMNRSTKGLRKPTKNRGSSPFLPTVRRRRDQIKSSQSYRPSLSPIQISPLPGGIPSARETHGEKSSQQPAIQETPRPPTLLKSPQLP